MKAETRVVIYWVKRGIIGKQRHKKEFFQLNLILNFLCTSFESGVSFGRSFP